MVEGRVLGHDAMFGAHSAWLDSIEADLLLSKSLPPAQVDIDDEERDKLPRQHILRSNCSTLCSLEAAQSAIDGAFDGVAKPTEYVVILAGKGQGLAKQWIVESVGPVATAARRAQEALPA